MSTRCCGCDKVLSDEEIYQVYREECNYYKALDYEGGNGSPPKPTCFECRFSAHRDGIVDFEVGDFEVDFEVYEENQEEEEY